MLQPTAQMAFEDEDMAQATGTKCHNAIKVPFFIINLVTWVAGGGLIGIAIWIVTENNEYRHFIENKNIFVLYISLSALLFTAGILGTCGVLLGNKCLLHVYFVIICVVFGTLIGLVVFAILQRSRVDKILKDSWNKTSDETRIFLQNRFDCCGMGEEATNAQSNLDISCFVNATLKTERKKDCLKKLRDWFEDNQVGISSGIAGIMLLMIFLMVTSCWLTRKLETTRVLKRGRVGPSNKDNLDDGNNNRTITIRPYNSDCEDKEMVAIEEPTPAACHRNGKNEPRTAKKKRLSHQRESWAKHSSWTK